MKITYYNKQTKIYNQAMQIKRVLIKWCKIALISFTIYASLYLFMVAAGCPY